MSAHEPFEQLCALAVTGDLNPEEYQRLAAHLAECASCRASYADFHTIIETGLPSLERPSQPRWSFRHLGMKRRFLNRAEREGIPIKRPDRRRSPKLRFFAPVTAACLVVIALSAYGWRLYQSSIARQQTAATKLTALSNKVADLERRLADKVGSSVPTVQPSSGPTDPITSELNRVRDLQVQLSKLQTDYDAVLAERAELEGRISSVSKDAEKFRADSQASREEIARLESNLQRLSASAPRIDTRPAPAAANTRPANTVAIDTQQARIAELEAKVREQEEMIARERQLLTDGKDIRDLMSARNLHVIEVQDVGASGKTSPTLARIFYTEGKSLTFYAYDLQTKADINKVDFQVWGKKGRQSQQPRSLGILYTDDSKQNRWVLKFNDAAVLDQIDQLFVTVEPIGGSKQPRGKQLLTAAFLNEAPNHP
jgi:Tfp pilus assembly protein PilN